MKYFLRADEGGADLSGEEHGRFGSLLVKKQYKEAARHLRIAVQADAVKWQPFLTRADFDTDLALDNARLAYTKSY